MSFKSWSLANPEKTRGYRILQDNLTRLEESIRTYEARLERAKAGVVPEPRDSFGGWLPDVAKHLFKTWSVNRTSPYTEDELALKEQAEQSRRNREAIAQEIDQCEKQLNGWDMDYGIPEREVSHQTGLYEYLSDLKARIAAYTPDSAHWNWREGYSDLDDIETVDREDVAEALYARLECLSGWNGHSNYDGDLDVLTIDLEEFLRFRVKAHADVCLQIQLRSSRWVVMISDGNLTFTRTHFLLTELLMYVWLSYLDHRWNEIVALHA